LSNEKYFEKAIEAVNDGIRKKSEFEREQAAKTAEYTRGRTDKLADEEATRTRQTEGAGKVEKALSSLVPSVTGGEVTREEAIKQLPAETMAPAGEFTTKTKLEGFRTQAEIDKEREDKETAKRGGRKPGDLSDEAKLALKNYEDKRDKMTDLRKERDKLKTAFQKAPAQLTKYKAALKTDPSQADMLSGLIEDTQTLISTGKEQIAGLDDRERTYQSEYDAAGEKVRSMGLGD
jgi:hypothetical protein